MRRAVLAVLVAACGAPGPRALGYDSESCTQCHMTLTDRRFGGELVLQTGKVIPFDDAGCLVTYLGLEPGLAERLHSVWVSDFLPPNDLLRAEEAVFLVSDAIRTPMDYRVAALKPGPQADSLRSRLGGELVSWDAVQAVIRSRAIAGGVP